MKSIKIFFAAIIIGSIMSPSQLLAQQNNEGTSLGVGIKASTNGFGADIIIGFSTPISVRLGFERYTFLASPSFNEQGISYNSDIKAQTGSISLLGDFYFGKYFFVTGGLASSLLKVNFDGRAADALPFGDIEIPPDLIGDFSFVISPNSKIMPYIGLGVGRTLGLNKEVGFAFELGGFYQGQLGIDITSSGLLSPTSNPDHGHAERLGNQLSQYVWYPIAKFSLNYKITKF